MVTLDEIPKIMHNNTREFSFNGLSTDDKPIGSYEGMAIANGSTFLEVDTHTVYFYDEEGAQWH